MCGIVGYVGGAAALDVVVEGLRRLEYRGYDSAGVAVLARRRRWPRRKKAGKLANLREGAGRPAAAGRRRPASGTPAGPPTARPTDRNAHPHLDDDGPGRRHPQRHHRELRRAAGRAGGARPRAAQPRPTPRSSPTCSAEAFAGARRPGRGDAAGRAAGSRARSRWSPCTPTQPDVVVGARRNSPLVVGVGEGENFLGIRRRRVHRAHPRGDRARPGPGRRAAPRRRHGHRLRRRARPRCSAFHVDWDASAAEKGGYDYFMLKEIAEQPKAVADTLLGPDRRRRPARARRDAACPTRSCARSTRSSSSPAAPPSTPG